MTKQFSREDLKKFVTDTIWMMIPEDSSAERAVMVNMINSRVDMAFQPFEDWITVDGELDPIIEIVEKSLY